MMSVLLPRLVMITDQEAFLLHRRAYGETSSIARFWVRDLGLISAVVKGVRGKAPKAVLRNAWLQPFQPLSIQLRGRSDLKNVYQFEPSASNNVLTEECLFSGLYLNSLLLSVLEAYELEIVVFEYYEVLLQRLAEICCARNCAEHQKNRNQKALNHILAQDLRQFEMQLLTG